MSELHQLVDEIEAAHRFVMEKAETHPNLADIAMGSLAKHDVPKLLAAITALREQIAGLTAALQQAQEFVLTVEYTDRFDNMYWAMADTLTKAIDAALSAVSAPAAEE